MASKKNKKTKLPDKLSELLKVALADLEAVEKNPNYRVNMGAWHEPGYEDEDGVQEPCEVCFAGAVMAQTLKAPDNDALGPHDFDDGVGDKLQALDYLRQGMVYDAMDMIWQSTALDRVVADYHDDPKQFKADMKQLVKDLEKAGL